MIGEVINAWEQPIGKKLKQFYQEGNEWVKKRLEDCFDLLSAYLLLDFTSVANDLKKLYKFNGSGQKPKEVELLLRSLLVNLLFAQKGLTAWSRMLVSDEFYSILCGLDPDDHIAVGTFYLFLDRIHNAGARVGENGLTPSQQHSLNRKAEHQKREKPEDLEKEKERNLNVSEKLANTLDLQRDDSLAVTIQTVLAVLLLKIAVATSARLGLIPPDITVCGDGSCIHTHASPEGVKSCSCPHGTPCEHDRHYSDPLAQWGYDASNKQYFFGHRMYQYVSPDNKHNLPLIVGIGAGNESDYTLSLTVFEVLRKAIPQTLGEHVIKRVVLDAGHDSLPHHLFFRNRGVEPFIDIRNSAKSVTINEKPVVINNNCIPVCSAGAEMRLHTLIKRRETFVFSCPAKKATHLKGKSIYTFRPTLCPQNCDCMPDSSIGPFVSIPSKTNPRLYPSTPRNSQCYKTTMKLRSSVERSNSVKKETFGIEYRFRTQAYFLIFLTCISILEHVIAWSKEIKSQITDLENLTMTILQQQQGVPSLT